MFYLPAMKKIMMKFSESVQPDEAWICLSGRSLSPKYVFYKREEGLLLDLNKFPYVPFVQNENLLFKYYGIKVDLKDWHQFQRYEMIGKVYPRASKKFKGEMDLTTSDLSITNKRYAVRTTRE